MTFKVGDVVRIKNGGLTIGIITKVNEERLFGFTVYILATSRHTSYGKINNFSLSVLSHNLCETPCVE